MHPVLASSSSDQSKLAISGFSSSSKYNGLIEKSFAKQLRNLIIQLICYIDTFSPCWYSLHEIVSFLRIIQVIGPTYLSCFSSIWVPGTESYSALGIISVFYQAVPTQLLEKATIFVYSSFCVLFFAFFVVLIVSSYFYSKYARIIQGIAEFITFFISTIGYLFPPIIMKFCGGTAAKMVLDPTFFDNMSIELICMICSVIFFVLYSWFFCSSYAISFIFRPTSLLSVNGDFQIRMYFFSASLSLYLGFSSKMKKENHSILLFTGFVLFVLYSFLFGKKSSIVSYKHDKLMRCSLINGSINLLLFTVFAKLGIVGNNTLFFSLIGISVLSFIISSYITERRIHQHLVKLDQILENPSEFDSFNSSQSSIKVLLSGLSMAHPVCIDWSLFRRITEKWPNDPIVWVTFGKFISIYPEESSILSFVLHTVISKQFKGLMIKQMISQSIIIMQQRESNLTAVLKHKLEKVNRHVVSTKRKLRRIWDQVIQGNTGEMESNINNAYRSVTECDIEYKQVLTQFPNNRFVFRSYARFLSEIIGNYEEKVIWHDKIRLLQRGVLVHQDRTQELGLHAYPILPTSISKLSQPALQIESESQISEQDLDDEQLSAKCEETSVLRDMINNISIPSTKCISNTTIIMCIVIVTLSVLPTSFASLVADYLAEPLDLLYHLTNLRTICVLTPILSHRYLLENVPSIDNPILYPPNFTTGLPSSFGYGNQTSDHIRYLSLSSSNSLQKIDSYRSFRSSDSGFLPIREALFGSTVLYHSYIQEKNPYSYNSSLHGAFIDFSIQSLSILQSTNFSNSSFLSIQLLNPLNNRDNVEKYIDSLIISVLNYLFDQNNDVQKFVRIAMISFSIFGVLQLSLIMFVELYLLHDNKTIIYKALMALPKNVVSSVVESLRTIKKEDPDTSKNTEVDSEVSKQEENVIKIFVAASDSNHSEFSTNTFLVFGNIFAYGSIIAVVIVGLDIFFDECELLTSTAPHIDNILHSYNSLVKTFLWINEIIGSQNGYYTNSSHAFSANNSLLLISSFIHGYNRAKFGGNTSSETPLSTINGMLSNSNSIYNCTNFFEIPKNMQDIYGCLTPELNIRLIDPFLHKLIDPFLNDTAKLPTKDNVYLQEGWFLSLYQFYDLYFHPIYESVIPTINDEISQIVPRSLLAVVLLLCTIVFASAAIVIHNATVFRTIIFTLNLFLQCPYQSILQNSKIISIISGDFDSSEKEQTNRDSSFYENVVNELPDAIIVCDSSLIVISTNKKSENIFQIHPTELIGKSIKDFLIPSHFSGDISSLYKTQNKLSHIESEYMLPNEDKLFLHLTSTFCGTNFVLSARNYTQTVFYNRLISEERQKSDKLLMSILPSSLVPRVQNGEKNISFSVQNASIVFIDIVGFTPWCADNTAGRVMQTLSSLFREFDSIISNLPVLSKIKCIGDCYMAAGGIFDDVSQPGTNAKEAVLFGLQSIEAVKRLNKSLDLNLQIRVGVHIGGPVIAGVLGTEKPTFEILGPTISFAQQMEHHGIPMSVHISRSVYELIYGGSFSIQERGQISIKGGNVLTYLVN